MGEEMNTFKNENLLQFIPQYEIKSKVTNLIIYKGPLSNYNVERWQKDKYVEIRLLNGGSNNGKNF